MAGRRFTIGYFNQVLVGEWATLPWQGAQETARSRGADLISFHGQSVLEENDFDGQENVVYALPRGGRLDGLIAWKGHLTSHFSDDETAQFYRHYGVPVVTIEGRLEGFLCVTYGNYEGMKLIVDHLATGHGFTKIAFLGLVEKHPGFQERYRGYLDAMREHGRPVDPDFVQPWCPWDGVVQGRPVEEALDGWLREALDRGVEAVIGSCDPVAIWALRRLERMGKSVPYDIALAGFDGFSDSRLVSPPLTTINPSWSELGVRAVDAVLDLIEKKPVPEIVVVPPRLVIARTCGCPEPSVRRAGRRAAFRSRATLVADIDAALDGRVSDGAGEAIANAFLAEAKGKPDGSFLKVLDLRLRETTGEPVATFAWQDVISTLSAYAGKALLGRKKRDDANLLCHQARAFAGLAAFRRLESARAGRYDGLLDEHRFGLKLISNFSLERVVGLLASGLPALGIGRAYLVIFENPATYRYPDPAPEWSRLVLAIDETGRMELAPSGLRFPTRRLVPDEAWDRNRDRPMLLSVHNLHFREEQIGYMVFEADAAAANLYNTLAGQIASSLQGTLLLSRINSQYEMLEIGIGSLTKSVDDMVAHIGSISENISRQSAAVEESAASIRQMKGNIDGITGISRKAAEISRDLDAVVNESIASIKNLLQSIAGVRTKSGDVLTLLTLIGEIADKTKLLALNASIEASHAGESGRGFTVVSKEIRALAENADASLEKIKSVVGALGTAVGEAAALSAKIEENLGHMGSDLKLNTDAAGALALAMVEQDRGTGEILKAVVELVGITSDIKATVSAQVAATEEFKVALMDLNRLSADGEK